MVHAELKRERCRFYKYWRQKQTLDSLKSQKKKKVSQMDLVSVIFEGRVMIMGRKCQENTKH